MKNILLTSVKSFILFVLIQSSTLADNKSDSDLLFNYFEDNFPTYISPSRQTSQTLNEWYYRFYSVTNSYVGFNSTDNNIYYLGTSLLNLGSLQSLMTQSGLGVNSLTRGKTTYDKDCSSCHGSNPLNGIDGILDARDPNKTARAIARNKGGMGFLSTLTSTDLQDIADYINSLFK